MAGPSLLLDFAVLLIAAEVGGTLFRFLHLPRVGGMVVAGIVLGPFTPGYVVSAMMVMLGTAVLPGLLVKFPRRNPPPDSRTPEGPAGNRPVGDPKR